MCAITPGPITVYIIQILNWHVESDIGLECDFLKLSFQQRILAEIVLF